MSESKRVQLILTDEINTEIEKVAKRQAANKSALIRMILANWLESEHGVNVSHTLAWGGDRTANPAASPTEG